MSRRLGCSLNVSYYFGAAPLVEALDGAVAAGFRTIELLDPFRHDPGALEAALEERRLHVDLFNLPMGDFEAGERGFAADPGRREEFRAGVERAVEMAERLRPSKVNALAGNRSADETESAQLDCLVEQLAWAADRLGAVDVRVNTELLNPIETPSFLLTSMDVVRHVLDQLDGRVGFQLDVYHLARSGYDPVAVIEESADVTGHVQIADAPERTEPGSGEVDFASVVTAVTASGYDGLIGCEYRPRRGGRPGFAWMEPLGLARA
jgi:hydroxypyruvate isomerase